MSNITKIRISGTSYNIKDENACNVVELTQAQYDVLPTTAKTSNSLFVITDASPIDISDYWTSAQTQSAITEAISGKVDTTAFNTYSASTNARIREDEEVTAAALNALDEELSGKQNTLVAGSGISINGNVISADGSSITVDSALSSTSENPVQNKVIYQAIGDIETLLAAI